LVSLPRSFVANIKHKAHIEVDKNGTKAAAVTLMACSGGAAPSVPRFEVRFDRPFVFAIVHEESGLPLFLGVINTVNK